MKSCKCLPPVKDAAFRAHITTGGRCVFSPGKTIEEALQNVILHARRDGLAKDRWADCWVEDIETAEVVREFTGAVK